VSTPTLLRGATRPSPEQSSGLSPHPPAGVRFKTRGARYNHVGSRQFVVARLRRRLLRPFLAFGRSVPVLHHRGHSLWHCLLPFQRFCVPALWPRAGPCGMARRETARGHGLHVDPLDSLRGRLEYDRVRCGGHSLLHHHHRHPLRPGLLQSGQGEPQPARQARRHHRRGSGAPPEDYDGRPAHDPGQHPAVPAPGLPSPLGLPAGGGAVSGRPHDAVFCLLPPWARPRRRISGAQNAKTAVSLVWRLSQRLGRLRLLLQAGVPPFRGDSPRMHRGGGAGEEKFSGGRRGILLA